MLITVFAACAAFLLVLWGVGAPAFPSLYLSGIFAAVAMLLVARQWRGAKQPVEKKDKAP